MTEDQRLKEIDRLRIALDEPCLPYRSVAAEETAELVAQPAR
jgi:hypothetical protein